MKLRKSSELVQGAGGRGQGATGRLGRPQPPDIWSIQHLPETSTLKQDFIAIVKVNEESFVSLVFPRLPNPPAPLRQPYIGQSPQRGGGGGLSGCRKKHLRVLHATSFMHLYLNKSSTFARLVFEAVSDELQVVQWFSLLLLVAATNTALPPPPPTWDTRRVWSSFIPLDSSKPSTQKR